MMTHQTFQGTAVELVLFDLDGTLIDSKVDIAKCSEFHAEGFRVTTTIT